MVSGVDAWLANDVQKAAMTWFGQPVIELITFGSFSCRPMNNRSGANLSEHSFANAVDAKGFRLADGRVVTVIKGWRGQQDEQGFLREVAIGACTHFSTVLAPGSDAYHYDHIHVDMARRSRGRHVCRPALQMPAPPQFLAQQQAMPQAGYAPAPGGQQQMFVKPSVPAPKAAAWPSKSDLYTGPDDATEEVEDLRGERNFDGKQFDLTGSIRRPDDPPVVVQRPGRVNR